jgi:DNA polymerase elongation subunit (family B)
MELTNSQTHKLTNSTFTPVDYDTFDYNGRNYVKIYGRNENKDKICIIDTCPIFMWAILTDNATNEQIKKLKKKISEIYIQTKDRTTKIEKIELHNKKFLGKDVKALKIFATNYKDLKDIASKLDDDIIYKRRGHDLGFITHYIIEKDIAPLNTYKIQTKEINEEDYDEIATTLEVKKTLKLSSSAQMLKCSNADFDPKVLAFDIETDALTPERGEMVMVSLVANDYKKVITWKKDNDATIPEYVDIYENEKEMIEAFVKEVKKYSPDFLIGYNTDGFDLPFIKKRAQIIKAKCDLSLDRSNIRILKGIPPIGKLSGLSHIDLYKFVKTTYAQYMQSETLSLNDVAKEFLGNNKTGFQIDHSSKLNGKWNDYYEYCIQDSQLVIDLFKKFWPDLYEFTKVIKEPTFNVSRNGLAKQLEGFILHNLKKFNEIPERKPSQRELASRLQLGTVEGAFVYEPTPGLYEDIAMFDFTSMHTSIIITHNIGKETLVTEPEVRSDLSKLEDNNNSIPTESVNSSLTNSQTHKLTNSYYESPEIDIYGKKKKFYFSKKPGFFPTLLKEIFKKRKQHKEEYQKNPTPINKARSNAFKVLSASAHGYIGFNGARYFSWEASSAILAYVRYFNQQTIQKIKDKGHKVIYGDTDSVAFTKEGKSEKEINQLLNQLNSELPGVMHLESEGTFQRGIWVKTRNGDVGAKKKYALRRENGTVKIRGFETVRRDWCKLARKNQDKVLRLILEDGNEKRALEYVKENIQKIKERKIPNQELLIKTQLKKQLSEYKAIGPHVTAAKKMIEKGEDVGEGTLIEYYIGEGQGKLVRDKACLKDEKIPYNIKYYLE